MKVKKQDVVMAEKQYASMLMKYGEENLATQRALIRWYDLKREYNKKHSKSV